MGYFTPIFVKTKYFLFLAIFLASQLPVEASYSWKTCDGKQNLPIQVDSLTLSPDPPRRGSSMLVQVLGTNLADPVPGGTFALAVKYLGMHVYSRREPLCQAMACPLPNGSFAVDMSYSLPYLAPPGQYDVTLQVIDPEDASVLCVVLNMHISAASLKRTVLA